MGAPKKDMKRRHRNRLYLKIIDADYDWLFDHAENKDIPINVLARNYLIERIKQEQLMKNGQYKSEINHKVA